jgi:hypothetical protein
VGGAGWLGRAAREGGAEAGGGAAGGYLLALGQLSHRDFLHVALRVEVRELQVGGQLRAAPDWGRQYRDSRCAAGARAPKAPELRCNTALSPCHRRRWPAWPGSGATACELEPAREQGTGGCEPARRELGGRAQGQLECEACLAGRCQTLQRRRRHPSRGQHAGRADPVGCRHGRHAECCRMFRMLLLARVLKGRHNPAAGTAGQVGRFYGVLTKFSTFVSFGAWFSGTSKQYCSANRRPCKPGAELGLG